MIRRDFQRLLAATLLGSQTPIRAASHKKITVIGAGLAGLAAARQLQQMGHEVLVLEARDRLGGRIWTSQQWSDLPLDLGASWIHGTEGNPLTALADKLGAKRMVTRYENSQTYGPEGRMLTASQERQLEKLKKLFWEAIEKSQKKNADVSVRQAVQSLFQRADPQERLLLHFLLSSEVEQEYAGASHQLSAHWFDAPKSFSGDDVLFEQGYKVIVEALAQGLNIQTGHAVQSVRWNTSQVQVTTTQGEHTADQVVVTLPLGVLKAGRVAFHPDLPEPQRKAIDGLGMGLLNKCYLRFEKAFWPEKLDWIEHVSAQPGVWTEWVSLMRITQKPVLLGFNAAERAHEIEGLTDEQTLQDAMKTLHMLFGPNIPDPLDAQVTRWASDPFALGSYSFNALGSTPQMRQNLGLPLANKVFFAGEATEEHHFGTAHGAYLSGLRAASEAAKV